MIPCATDAGIFCASFYHFFVNDQTGPIGIWLRSAFPEAVRMGLDEATFAAAFVSLFMQVTGLLQMPDFLGPSFSPFGVEILSPWKDSSTWSWSKKESVYSNRKKAKQQQQKLKKK